MQYYALTLALLACSGGAALAGNASTNGLLAAAGQREAAGGPAWDRVVGLRAEGDENNSGMRGRWRALDDIATGRMRRTSDFGIVRTAEVWDGQRHWRQDISGGVHPLDADFARRLAATDAWMATRSYLKPSHGGATFGAVEAASRGAAIRRRHGHPAGWRAAAARRRKRPSCCAH